MFPEYIESDPVKGCFAVFELGSSLGSVYFENLDITLHRETYPFSYLVCIGPKSARKGEREYFNPALSSHAELLDFKNIRINGEPVTNIKDYVREIIFSDIYNDGKSSGKGSISEINVN